VKVENFFYRRSALSTLRSVKFDILLLLLLLPFLQNEVLRSKWCKFVANSMAACTGANTVRGQGTEMERDLFLSIKGAE